MSAWPGNPDEIGEVDALLDQLRPVPWTGDVPLHLGWNTIIATATGVTTSTVRLEKEERMENTNGQPYTWYEPDKDEEHNGAIPTRAYNGWLKITRWNGQVTVINIETVRFLGTVTADILYPARPKGYPLYDDLFLQGGRKECITEAEALEWLRKHKLPLPEPKEPQVQDDPV